MCSFLRNLMPVTEWSIVIEDKNIAIDDLTYLIPNTLGYHFELMEDGCFPPALTLQTYPTQALYGLKVAKKRLDSGDPYNPHQPTFDAPIALTGNVGMQMRITGTPSLSLAVLHEGVTKAAGSWPHSIVDETNAQCRILITSTRAPTPWEIADRILAKKLRISALLLEGNARKPVLEADACIIVVGGKTQGKQMVC